MTLHSVMAEMDLQDRTLTFGVAAALLLLALSGGRACNLIDCLKDNDYKQLLQMAQEGLPVVKVPHSVVIVGAGMAGMTAAKLLQDAGHKVVVLEANSRVGGRVETYRDQERTWYADLGAMRFPSSHQILHYYINTFGLPLGNFTMVDNQTFYLVNGVLKKNYEVQNNSDILRYNVTDSERGKSPQQLLEEPLKKINDYVKAHDCPAALKRFDGYSVQAYLIKEGNLSTEAVRMIGELWNEQSMMYTALTEFLYDISDINDNITYHEIIGGSDLLVDAFNSRIRPKIRLNAVVKRINSSNGEVVVSFRKDGLRNLRHLRADAVLVTTTAKAALYLDFHPPLSTQKMAALAGVHYDSSTKVILTFRERFWEKDGIRGGKSITSRPSRFIYYPSHSFNSTVGVLLASYTWSDDSFLFLGASDQELKELVLNDLVLIHGESVRELCTGVVVKKWSQDPHSHGAFALFTPYQHLEYAAELFRNEGRIYFAGEHTAFPHAWVEGAMKSAIRAATKINKIARGELE